MSTLEFQLDPGPLPFWHVRSEKWANRLVDLPMPARIYVQSTGRRAIGLVTAWRPVGPGDQISEVYGTRRGLILVRVVAPEPCIAHAPDPEWGMCAHCGAPNETSSQTPLEREFQPVT